MGRIVAFYAYFHILCQLAIRKGPFDSVLTLNELKVPPGNRLSEDFWLNIQLRLDLFKARQKENCELKRIRPYKSSRQSMATPNASY